LAVLATLVFAVTVVAGWRGTGHHGGAVPLTASAPTHESANGRATPESTNGVATPESANGRVTAESATGRVTSTAHPLPPSAPAVSRLVAAAASKPVLSPSARRSCPPAASACADLSTDLTWLQSGGKITYGPVRMKPGLPRTPRGTFHVQWKAGADYVSTEFGEPMPYAVFFAPGGIAFHGGSLTKKSHGCIHLNIDSARYYDDHLPVGAEVVVF
jgi:lipoprotein-anchoring transpeptidase ErfK/SrfK